MQKVRVGLAKQRRYVSRRRREPRASRRAKELWRMAGHVVAVPVYFDFLDSKGNVVRSEYRGRRLVRVRFS